MEFPDYISFGKIGGIWDTVASRYLRVIGIGPIFIGKFGELAGKRAVTVNFEQVRKEGGVVVENTYSKFNGVKSYTPVDASGIAPFKVGDIVNIRSTSVSKAYGTDLHGTATINYKHLVAITVGEMEEEPQREARLDLSAEFRKVIDESSKAYKYNTIQRYMNDPQLREKYRVELANIDQIYKGPGHQFPWKDLEKEFQDRK